MTSLSPDFDDYFFRIDSENIFADKVKSGEITISIGHLTNS